MVVVFVTNYSSTLAINLGGEAIQKGIFLSESLPIGDDVDPQSLLKAEPLTDTWNISGDSIPANVNTIDGDNSTENYLAYSFYVVNGGNVDVNLTFVTTIIKTTRNLDQTIRIRIYIDDETPITYAKLADDGSPEPGTVPIESDGSIIRIIGSMAPDEYIRVTFLMWIEGADPDTTNDKIGGSIALNAEFKVIG